jgi:leucyl-tRNA synthetase
MAELEIIPIIKTPKYGILIARTVVQNMKINLPNDAKLPEAKEEAYKEGFYHGTMIYGDYKGHPVSEAKELVRENLISSGNAFSFAEPDGLVIGRSGDECVAAHLDQWYLNFATTTQRGDGEWCQQVRLARCVGGDGAYVEAGGKEMSQCGHYGGQGRKSVGGNCSYC